MRFHLGSIPESRDFVPDASWQLVREPSPGAWLIMALPTGLLAGGVFAVLWVALTPLVFALDTLAFLASTSARIVCVVGVIVAHELIHIAIQPKAGGSPYSVLVFWPARFLLFAAYTGELTRKRCLVMLLMPFVLLSVVSLLIAVVTQEALEWVAFTSTFNALLAGGDIVSTAIAVRRIPPGGIVRMHGWNTFLRRAEPHAAPNGGPTAPVDNSKVTEGPPSVS
jgi:hypothetical protein